MPGLVLIAAVIAATIIVVASGLFGSPAAVAAAAPVLAVTALIRMPDARQHAASMLALLLLGWLGGALAVLMVDPRSAVHLREAASETSDRDHVDALNLGHATAGREGILVDSAHAPAVVLGRGHARGIFAPQSEPFELAVLFARIDAPFVAMPDPRSIAGAQDQLNRVFPKLFHDGVSGYRLVYQNPTWRLFARIARGEAANR